MGFLKGMKDMKATVAAAPGMIDQAQQMAASAQAMQAAQMQQMMAQQQVAAQPLPAEALAPVNGVDLATYAWVGKRVSEHNYDASFSHQYAAQKGISAADWDAAAAGWTARMQQYPGVGTEFRKYYDVA